MQRMRFIEYRAYDIPRFIALQDFDVCMFSLNSTETVSETSSVVEPQISIESYNDF